MAKKITQTDIPEINDSDELYEDELISKSQRKRDAEAKAAEEAAARLE